jgi:membrane-bound lytic murein transglycosylase D
MAVACGSALKSQAPSVTPSTVISVPERAVQAPAPPPAPVEDPVLTLIASSDRFFKTGQRELEQGHVEAAKQEFNRAVDVLLESPYGARTEPRIREHFDRLVDRISTYEVGRWPPATGLPRRNTSLRPSTNCWRCRRRSERPPAEPSLKDASVGPADCATRHPHPLNQRVLAYIGLFQGRLPDFIEEGMKRGSNICR